MSAIEQPIRHLAPSGLRIHLWPCAAGYQANVSEPGTNAWTVFTAADPIDAMATALRQRSARVPDRVVEVEIEVTAEEPTDMVDQRQIDIEDYLAAEPDPFDEMFD